MENESFGEMFEKHLQEHPEEFQIRRAEKTKKYWTPTAQRARRILEEHKEYAKAEDEYTLFKIDQAVENGGKIIRTRETQHLISKFGVPQIHYKRRKNWTQRNYFIFRRHAW